MDPKERERKLDRWLDEALSHYNDAEPRLGLERRVLARLQEEEKPAKRTVSWWRWMPALAAAAAVVIVAVAVRPVLEKHIERKPEPATYSAAPSAPTTKKTEEPEKSTAETAKAQLPALKPKGTPRVMAPSTPRPAEQVAKSSAPSDERNDSNAPALAAKVGHTEQTVEVQSQAEVVAGVLGETAAAPGISVAPAPPPPPSTAAPVRTMMAMAPQMRASANLAQAQATRSFPSAVPLTQEERELLEYSAKLAEPAQRVERMNGLAEIPQIEIRHIEIAPLEGPQK